MGGRAPAMKVHKIRGRPQPEEGEALLLLLGWLAGSIGIVDWTRLV